MVVTGTGDELDLLGKREGGVKDEIKTFSRRSWYDRLSSG